MKIVDKIRNEVIKLNSDQTMLFIYTLVRRQKNMFDIIAELHKWEDLDAVSLIFDEITRAIKKRKQLDNSLQEYNIEQFGWECDDDCLMAIVFAFWDTLIAFYNQIKHIDDIDYSFSQCNFDLLENILYDLELWEGESENTYMLNDYVKQEQEREERDLILIQKGVFELDMYKDESIIDTELIKKYGIE